MTVWSYLELDILECEVKWALGSITTNKARGSDGIPAELFQTLKNDVKMLEKYYLAGYKIKSQRKAMPNMFKLLHNCTHLTH